MKNIFTNIQLRLLKRKKRFVPGRLKTSFGVITYIDSLSTYHQYKTIMKGGIYDISTLTPEPRYIIDCGANIGVATLYFSNKYPQAKIVAFEPQAQAFSALKENLKGKTNIQILQKAVWNKNGVIDFNSSPSDAGSLTVAPNKSEKVRVEATSLLPYLNDPVDLLKIDIEGAEYDVLKDIEPKLTMIKNIFIEYHASSLNGKDLVDMLSILSRAGFSYYLSPESVPGAPFKNMHKRKSGNFYYQINIFASRL